MTDIAYFEPIWPANSIYGNTQVLDNTFYKTHL